MPVPGVGEGWTKQCIQAHRLAMAPACCQVRVGHHPSTTHYLAWPGSLVVQESGAEPLPYLPACPVRSLVHLWQCLAGWVGRNGRDWRPAYHWARETGQADHPCCPPALMANAGRRCSGKMSNGDHGLTCQWLEQSSVVPEGKGGEGGQHVLPYWLAGTLEGGGSSPGTVRHPFAARPSPPSCHLV